MATWSMTTEERVAAERLIEQGHTNREVADATGINIERVGYLRKKVIDRKAQKMDGRALPVRQRVEGRINAKLTAAQVDEIIGYKGKENPATLRAWTQDEVGALYNITKGHVGKLWQTGTEGDDGRPVLPSEAAWRLRLVMEIATRPGNGRELAERIGRSRLQTTATLAALRELGYDIRTEGGGPGSKYVLKNLQLVAPDEDAPGVAGAFESLPGAAGGPDLPEVPAPPREPSEADRAAAKLPPSALPRAVALGILFDRPVDYVPGEMIPDTVLDGKPVPGPQVVDAVAARWNVGPDSVRSLWSGRRQKALFREFQAKIGQMAAKAATWPQEPSEGGVDGGDLPGPAGASAGKPGPLKGRVATATA